MVEFVVAALQPLTVTDHLVAVLITVRHLGAKALAKARIDRLAASLLKGLPLGSTDRQITAGVDVRKDEVAGEIFTEEYQAQLIVKLDASTLVTTLSLANALAGGE